MGSLSLSPEAAEAFVARHLDQVRGHLYVLGCPSRLLDDLVQEVFLAVLRSGFTERSPAQSAAYLRKVGRSLLFKALERERRVPLLSELDAAEAAWDDYRGDDDGDGYRAALGECLGRLRRRARTVLELRYGERLDRAAVAARLGLTTEGVKSILARAKRALRECVEGRLAS